MSKFSVQPPHILASLPRPINISNGRYVVGEVYGGAQPGSKKRKRAELAIGIDGEGINMYDIATARLLTSYALPPQSTFSCAPTSTRAKIAKGKVVRRTYVSTFNPTQQLSLFTETIEGSNSTSTTKTQSIEGSSSPVLFLGSISTSRLTDNNAAVSDLVAVKQDGSIQCWDGENLKAKWSSPASALVREDHIASDTISVEHVQLTTVHASINGLLKGRSDILSLFPEEISEYGYNPELLVLVTRTSDTRSLRVVAMPQRSPVGNIQQFAETVLVMELPSQELASFNTTPSYSFQASTGILQQLSGHRLLTFDVTGALPKIASRLHSTGAQSFLRLSNTSVMVSTESTITVYNPKYQSILTRIELDSLASIETHKRKRSSQEFSSSVNDICNFVAYFPKLATAVAISGNNLVALQIEGQLDRQGRPRPAGLLIDSIGCSAKEQFPISHTKKAKSAVGVNLKTLDLRHLAATSNVPWAEQTAELDKLSISADTAAFDELLATKLNIDRSLNAAANGNSKDLAQIKGEVQPSSLSVVEKRRWILYALSKIFTISEIDGVQQLTIAMYPPVVFAWILREGGMTVQNVEIAQKNKMETSDVYIQPGALVRLLEDIDPEMDLLLGLVSHNHLDATELVHAIKRLMGSLGLFGETAMKQALLTNGEEEGFDEDGDPEEQLLRLEAEALNDLAMAEYQLGTGSGVRGQALSMALAKLYTRPDNTITYAIQSTLSTSETVGLIGLLRYELSRGGWTSRYVDIGESLLDEDAEVPDHAIILIVSLLNNCIDAIGAGGWLAGEARLVNGDSFEAQELITSLKLEVEAAFEGVEQARYLSGILGEMVRYSEQVQKSQPGNKPHDETAEKPRSKPSRPKFVPIDEQEKMLPLGLKVDHSVSRMKVGAGGEIQKRTARDIGHLKSQKVGKYTLERIEV